MSPAFVLAAALAAAAGKKPPAPSPTPPPAPRVTVGVAALEVVGPGYGAPGSEVKPFGSAPGTRLTLVARAEPPFAVVSVDTQRSVIDEMRDGTGFFLPRPRWQRNAVSDDGREARVEMGSAGVPTERAAALIGMGRLGLTVAGGSLTLRSRSFNLRKGTAFTLGAGRVALVDVKRGRPSSLTFVGPRSLLGSVKALRFVAAGRLVPVPQWSARSDVESEFLTCQVDLAAANASLEVDVWQDLRTIAVPFAVQAGVGLDRPGAVTLAPVASPAAGVRSLDVALAGVKSIGHGAGEAEGVSVSLALTARPPFTIVSLEGEGLEMADDTGVGMGEPPLEVHPTADATAAVLDLRAAERPAPTASSLSVRGVLNVTVAAGIETVPVARVLLSVGDTFRLAGQVMTVSEVQTLTGELRFTIEGPSAVIDAVRAVRFRPRGQAAVPAEERGRRRGGVASSLVLSVSGVERAGDFEIEMWKQPRPVRLPFDVRAGVGLPAGLSSRNP